MLRDSVHSFFIVEIKGKKLKEILSVINNDRTCFISNYNFEKLVFRSSNFFNWFGVRYTFLSA